MKRHFSNIITVLCFLLVLSSCSDFQKVLKSDNVDKKYEAAIKYYEKGDYYRAGVLLEELIPLLRGSNESEKAQFYFANSQYQQDNYILSAYYFQSFFQTYPRSSFAEEAAFLHAKSLFKDSPSYNLDQTNTYAAMEALEEFMGRYPESEHVEEAQNIYNSLQQKLEVKAFESARLYHQLRYYKAAVVALETFGNEYPESVFSEEAAYLRLDSQYNLAKKSVYEKQSERFYDAISFYQSFIDRYPNSKYLKSAENMYSNSLNEIERLKTVSQNN